MQLAGWRLSETFVLISDYANKQLCHAPRSAATCSICSSWQASVASRSSKLLVPSVGPALKSRLKAACGRWGKAGAPRGPPARRCHLSPFPMWLELPRLFA